MSTTIDIPELTDPGDMTLDQLQQIATKLIDRYGPSAVITFDAGFNNIVATLAVPPSWKGGPNG